jgi:3-dehydroquinate dehydratase-2
MKQILLIHGPNLNKLGSRDPSIYGSLTLTDLQDQVKSKAHHLGYEIITFQSNHEGEIIDFIQCNSNQSVALIINPGAYSHYSYAIHDAIIDCQLPAIEVHLSDIKSREPWRQHSVISPACIHSISGKKIEGYMEALEYLHEY